MTDLKDANPAKWDGEGLSTLKPFDPILPATISESALEGIRIPDNADCVVLVLPAQPPLILRFGGEGNGN